MSEHEFTIDEDGESIVTVGLTDGASFAGHVSEIVRSPSVESLVEKMAKQTSPMLFYTYGNDSFPKEYAANLLDKYLGGGMVALNFAIYDACRGGDYYGQIFRDGIEGTDEWESLRDESYSLLRRLHPDVSPSDIRDYLDAELRNLATDRIQVKDTSVPMESIPDWARLEVCHVPSLTDSTGLDDIWIHQAARDVPGFVDPEPGLAGFLRMVNLGAEEVRAALRDAGQDVGTVPDGLDGYKLRQASENAAGWNALDVLSNPAKEALCSAEEAVEILENAGSGVPVIAFRVGLKAFIEAMETGEDIKVVPSGKHGHAQVGIHDFLNGAGHLLKTGPGEFTLSGDPAQWVVPSVKGYGIEMTYDFVMSYLDVDVSSVPKIELEESLAVAP